MTYPMPPELLEQLGLDSWPDVDVDWPEDRDAIGPSPHIVGEADGLDRTPKEVQDGC